MKKKLILLELLFLAFSSVSVMAQISIESTGRVVVGPDYGENFDPYGVLSMSIQGPETEYCNGGAKLGFGDFGRMGYNNSLGGWNVFIGEYGMTDSDIMWLHGKKGIRMTSENGSTILMELGCDASSRAIFYNGLLTGQIMVSSEDRFKRSLSPISGALSRLLQLGSVSYRYVLPREYSLTEEGREMLRDSVNTRSTESAALAGKDRLDSIRFAQSDSLRGAGRTLYGFVTSELEQQFPELVETDKDGNKYVDYISMIPLVIAAINEQQQTIEYLAAQLQECCKNGTNQEEDNLQDKNSGDGKGGGSAYIQPWQSSDPVLYQNAPNPFSSTTDISFHIPSEATSATMYVFTLSGTLVHDIPITTKGDGSVSIHGSTLTPGMYVYTLVVDNQIVDSKRMILTK
jgi:hypothetical protein